MFLNEHEGTKSHSFFKSSVLLPDQLEREIGGILHDQPSGVFKSGNFIKWGQALGLFATRIYPWVCVNCVWVLSRRPFPSISCFRAPKWLGPFRHCAGQ